MTWWWSGETQLLRGAWSTKGLEYEGLGECPHICNSGKHSWLLAVRSAIYPSYIYRNRSCLTVTDVLITHEPWRLVVRRSAIHPSDIYRNGFCLMATDVLITHDEPSRAVAWNYRSISDRYSPDCTSLFNYLDEDSQMKQAYTPAASCTWYYGDVA